MDHLERLENKVVDSLSFASEKFGFLYGMKFTF